MERPFQTVDVFADEPYLGNPLAVVGDAEGLSTDEMQRITRWMNLSETVFLLPPTEAEADYRVRIFTLDRELPFAGHPTLGSCHAWLTAGGVPRQDGMVVQECGAGLVPLRRGELLAFAAPSIIRGGPVDAADLDRAVAILGIDRSQVVGSQWIDNGPGWLGVLLGSADEVLAVEAAAVDGQRFDIGVAGPHPAGSDAAFEVRALFTDERNRLVEDPVTGSLNASLAQWLLATGRATAPFTTAQGTRLGRSGRPRLDADADGNVWVGGPTHTLVSGTIDT